MNLNLEYYKATDKNKITDAENQIIKDFFEVVETKRDLEDSLNINSSFEQIKSVSDNRKNIITFYPIKKDETVLEIGANFGELTGEFCKKAKRVVSIEGKKEKAEAISNRYKECGNLEIYAGELSDIKLNEKFDYITLIENSIENETEWDNVLSQIKQNLKPNGKILIVLDNKFGIKYWTGIKNDKQELAYDTITGKNENIELSCLQRKLKECNLETKVYYPMPDYVFTNAIYTDEFLPDIEHINSREWEFFNSQTQDVKFSEKAALKELVKKDKNNFKLFANSYLLVASNPKEDIDVKAVTYGIFRKPEYRIKTIIKNKEVVKTANNERAKSHIERIKENIELLEKAGVKTLDRFENDSIISKYVENGQTFDKIIIAVLKENKKDLAIQKIEEYKNSVLLKFETSLTHTNSVFAKYGIKCDPKEVKKLTFLKNGLYDLIFQNCFVIDNEFYVYDQEWIENNVPVEFIIYRSILNLPEIENCINHQELFEKLNISSFVSIFSELENKMQKEIKDDILWNLHAKSVSSILLNIEKEKNKNIELEEKLNREKQISDNLNEIAKLQKMVSDKDNHIQNLEQQLQVISGSLAWRITKIFKYLAWVFSPTSHAKFIDRIMPPGSRKRIKYDEKLTKKLWEEKINGYRMATDEEGVEYWKGIEHRERLKKERDVERLEKGAFFSDYEYWMRENDPTVEELDLQRKHKFRKKPKISIVIPLYNTPEDLFRELLFNMYRQTYSNWELCLADGSNEKLEYIEKMCKDPRIHYKFLGENKGISGNSNEGLKMVTGDYVALLDHDDLLMQNALFEIVKVINENPKVRFIYTDEDKMKTIDEPRFDPHFKPDFSPDYISGNNYICHFSVFKKEVMDKLGGFRDEYNGAQDLDIILRMSEIVKPEEIYHIPKILYHWRISETSTAGNPETKLYAYISGEKAVQHHIDRIGLKGTAVRDEKMYGIYRIKYDIIGNPKVNILIPNKNDVENLKKCVNSIIEKTTYQNYEIDIIDDNSNNVEIKNYYAELEKNNKVKIIKYNQENSNYAKLINYGAQNTEGEFIVQLANTNTIIANDWLESLVGYAQRDEIGAVAGKIFSEDDRILTAGIIVGGEKGKIYLNRGLGDDVYGYFAKECHVQNFSCVGTNSMICKRTVFEKVNGLNEDLTGFEDVDFCLSLRENGLLNVYMPYAQLYNSVSEDINDCDDESLRKIKEKWAKIYENSDIYFNPNLSLESNRYDVKKEKV